MEATIEYSVDLLDRDTAEALGELAVFAGSFDLAAAEEILASVVSGAPVLIVEELVNHSLVETYRTHGTVRYRLLEPVRQYAIAHLWQRPENTRDRHLEHYLQRLEDAYTILGASSSDPMQALIDSDLDNLGAVHNWALQCGRIDDDLRLYRPLMLADAHDVFEPGKGVPDFCL